MLAKGRYDFNRKKSAVTRTAYFLKGRRMQLYTACCETVLALPPGPACVHCSRVRNHRGIPWQKVSFIKYLILRSFEVTLAFAPLFRTAGSPPPGLPTGAAGQWGEQREVANGKC